MRLRGSAFIAALGLASALAGPVKAAPVYSEATSGDLSNTGLSPTVLSLVPGANDVFGQTGSTAGVADRDYFTFVVPAGQTLSSLTVLNVSLAAGSAAFIGLQSGGQVTVDPAAPNAALLLGYRHMAPADIGVDILPLMGVAAGAIGYALPLPSGQFSVWIQDTSVGPTTYGLRLGISSIPEPGTALLTLTGLVALGCRRRRQA